MKDKVGYSHIPVWFSFRHGSLPSNRYFEEKRCYVWKGGQISSSLHYFARWANDKNDDTQAMHSSVCLSEELSAKETICESAAPPQSLFVKRDRSGAVGERPPIKKENTKNVTCIRHSQKQMMFSLFVWFAEMRWPIVPCFLLNCGVISRESTPSWKINRLIFFQEVVQWNFGFTGNNDNTY